jgi:hypothetical protein
MTRISPSVTPQCLLKHSGKKRARATDLNWVLQFGVMISHISKAAKDRFGG